MSRPCRARASPSRIRTPRAAAVAAARSPPDEVIPPVSPVAHLDAGVSSEARDPSTSRGPSRLGHSAASALEKIRTIVVDDHQHIARLVANRIATLIREKQAAGENAVLGLAKGSTPIGL